MSLIKEISVWVPASKCTITPDGVVAVDASDWIASYEKGLERGKRPEPSPISCISPGVPSENRGPIIKKNSPRTR